MDGLPTVWAVENLNIAHEDFLSFGLIYPLTCF